MNKSEILYELFEIIREKRNSSSKDSYSAYLFEQGKEKIVNKFGEEAFELATAALAQSKDEIINETADVIFHLLILLENSNVSLENIWDKLRERMKPEKN